MGKVQTRFKRSTHQFLQLNVNFLFMLSKLSVIICTVTNNVSFLCKYLSTHTSSFAFLNDSYTIPKRNIFLSKECYPEALISDNFGKIPAIYKNFISYIING